VIKYPNFRYRVTAGVSWLLTLLT